MRREDPSRRARLTRGIPALAVVGAMVVIGCGGGGGTRSSALATNVSSDTGTVTTGSVTTGNVTSGTVTTGTVTTGSLTTGGGTTSGTGGATTGATSTTGGATGSSSTGSSTAGSSTGGTATSSSTTGGSSAGSSTSGSATTGSSTTGSSTTGTTGGSTTGGTTGGTPPPAGALRTNAIYFGHFYGDASAVTSILPDGTGRQDTAGGADGVVCAFPDPVNAGQTLYALAVNGSYGVYRGATFDPAASQILATPTYDSISTLQPASNGTVLLVASTGGTNHAYLLGGGVPQTIDEADTASISLDGSSVVYTKVVNDVSQMFVWTAASGVQPLASGMDALLPSFSRDGSFVVFSSDANGTGDAPWDLYQIPTAGGTIDRLTNTPGINEFGAAYNESRTMVSFVAQGLDPNDSGVYIWSNAGEVRLATDADVSFATYWTDSYGRASSRTSARSSRGARFQRLVRPKRRR